MVLQKFKSYLVSDNFFQAFRKSKFFIAHDKIVKWFLFACGPATGSVFSSRAVFLKLERVVDPPEDCGAWRDRRKTYILPLDVFFRRSLRSFYINCDDNKTLTYSRSCGITGFAISDLTIFQWYIQTSVTHINFIILPKHCYWGWRGSLSC